MDELIKQQQLLEMLKGGSLSDEIVDKQKVRYALYARKSTTGDEKQSSSIDDQIRDCIDRIIEPQGLNLVATYEEKFSAKEADTREEFKRLIKDIQLGRIDGVIAWHPDRLSRNMKEAGTIIDLVDKGSIKDLQFATFTFENNPAGKMLLGITFVMAKQYSEHLSESVDRGNRRAIEDGEFIGKFKHGYVIDADRHFQPDPDSFIKIKHMFEMALAHKSQKDIRFWINEQEYKVQKKQGADPVSHKWSKDDVSELLRDSHYAGVHKWGKNLITIAEFYEFQPMITVDQFFEINKIDNLDSSKVLALRRPRDETRADFLRGIVYCGHCNKPLTSMLIDKKKDGVIVSSRYYYKCETAGCAMEGKSARAKYVVDAAQKFLATYLFVNKTNFESFLKSAKTHIKKTQHGIDSAVAKLTKDISNKQTSYENIKKLIENDETGTLKRHYDLDETLADITEMQGRHARLLQMRRDAPSSLPTFQEYLKLFESTSVILGKIRDMKQMNAFIRIFFSNFTITATGEDFRRGSTVVYKLNEPYEGFVKNGDFVLGAGEETLTLDLFLGKEAL